MGSQSVLQIVCTLELGTNKYPLCWSYGTLQTVLFMRFLYVNTERKLNWKRSVPENKKLIEYYYWTIHITYNTNYRSSFYLPWQSLKRCPKAPTLQNRIYIYIFQLCPSIFKLGRYFSRWISTILKRFFGVKYLRVQ